MTVAPLYGPIPGASDTGIAVPVLVPAAAASSSKGGEEDDSEGEGEEGRAASGARACCSSSPSPSSCTLAPARLYALYDPGQNGTVVGATTTAQGKSRRGGNGSGGNGSGGGGNGAATASSSPSPVVARVFVSHPAFEVGPGGDIYADPA